MWRAKYILKYVYMLTGTNIYFSTPNSWFSIWGISRKLIPPVHSGAYYESIYGTALLSASYHQSFTSLRTGAARGHSHKGFNMRQGRPESKVTKVSGFYMRHVYMNPTKVEYHVFCYPFFKPVKKNYYGHFEGFRPCSNHCSRWLRPQAMLLYCTFSTGRLKG